MFLFERHVYLWTIVSVNQHYTNPTESVGRVESGYYIDIKLVVAMIQLKKLSYGAKQQSLTPIFLLFYNYYNHDCQLYVTTNKSNEKFEGTNGVIRIRINRR